MKKTASGIMLILLFVGVLTLAFNVQLAKASGTIYIRADGSIDPPTANITTVDNIIYTFTDNIINWIVVERDNIVVDGAGYTLQTWGGVGITLSHRSNVTAKNININNFDYGISLHFSSNNTITGNNITNNQCGIRLRSSSNNMISGNRFFNSGLCVGDSYENMVADNLVNGKPLVYLEEVSNYMVEHAGQVILVNCNSIQVENLNLSHTSTGVQLLGTNNAKIFGNNITENQCGISLASSNNNKIFGNNITNNYHGIIAGSSSNNTISKNNITSTSLGIWLKSSSNNTVSENNITDNPTGGMWLTSSSNNKIFRNNITANNGGGIALASSSKNTIARNNITENNAYGIHLFESSSNNIIYHNNFINNTVQVSIDSPNVWDDGYPSGGNYWSDYNGTDANGDGIGDTPYIIDTNNRDRYPLMNRWIPPEHDLVTSIMAPTSLLLGSSSSLSIIVTNEGLNDEANVKLQLLINGTIVNSTTIPLLKVGNSYTLSHLWTPTVAGTYNITAYASPVSGETSTENNQETRFVTVSSPPEVQVGVKAGDWIKVEYTISGWPAGQPYPEWLKVEFLSVEGTNATVRVTMHMSDGTEQNATVPVDIAVGGGEALGLSGFVIPANLTVGDSVYISGYGNVTIAGETTRTYAGASRTVVYASFSQYGTQLAYYWDKQTGVMVAASTTSGGVTATAKATETNMWEAAPSGLPIEPTVLYALIVVVIAIVAAVAFLAIRRKKKPPEELENPQY